jgi:hypothetical protein
MNAILQTREAGSLIHREDPGPEVGRIYRLPSTSLVEVTKVFSIAPQIGFRYRAAPWRIDRDGATRGDGDVVLSTDFVARFATPILKGS